MEVVGRPQTRLRYRYNCLCHDCKHRWVSQVNSGTPEMCPRPTCHGMQIEIVPIVPSEGYATVD